MVATSVKLKKLIKAGFGFRVRCAARARSRRRSATGKKHARAARPSKRAGTAKVVVRIAKKSRAKVRRLKGKKLTLRFKITTTGKTTTLTRKVRLKR